jgi:membrane protease YdiL (CAAX protease family)
MQVALPLQLLRSLKLSQMSRLAQPLLKNKWLDSLHSSHSGLLYLCCSFLICFALVPSFIGMVLGSWALSSKACWLLFIQQASIPVAWFFCFAGLKQQQGSLSLSKPAGFKLARKPQSTLLQTLHLVGVQGVMVLILLGLLAVSQVSAFTNPLKPFHGLLYWGFALLVFSSSPLLEELVFRGWLQGQLHNRFSPTASILMTSALFTCLHVGYRDNGLCFGLRLFFGFALWIVALALWFYLALCLGSCA